MITTSLLKKCLLGLVVVFAGSMLAHPPATRTQPNPNSQSIPLAPAKK